MASASQFRVTVRTRRTLFLFTFGLCATLPSVLLEAQQNNDARALVQRAVNVEIAADRSDHSTWRYHMAEKQENDSVYDVVETAQGSVKRKIQQAGRPLGPEEQKAETARIRTYIQDTRAQAKRRHDGEQDDKSAEKLLDLLPRAFLWRVAGENARQITLHFEPDPNFKAPDLESRVLAAMKGELTVDRGQQRIAVIRGTLAHDVEFGYGFLGKLRGGGTFNVERRELSPGVWQIVETHVHIDGRALLFKTIGQQTDEIKTGFQPVPPATTLAAAAAMLRVP